MTTPSDGPQASSLPTESQASSLPMVTHKGWCSRGYLPHFDQPGLVQGITFRLWDSLPSHVVESLIQEHKQITDAAKRARIESYLNTGHGACYLRDPRIGRLVENALLHFDGARYRMIAWVVMPNHVHTLIETIEGYPLHTILHSWKSYTANKANQILGRRGRFWFPEYFDRYIRDERHFANAVRYIHENPVKAGLVERPEEWPFSSARLLEGTRPSWSP
jgi:REP element-mobilizing transposase RayT